MDPLAGDGGADGRTGRVGAGHIRFAGPIVGDVIPLPNGRVKGHAIV